MLHELLFADDFALVAYTQEDLQRVVNNFTRAAILYHNIKKKEVMFQPKPGALTHDSVIKIGDDQLGFVQKFCYLGSFLLQDAYIDDNVMTRIGNTSAALGRLPHRV